MAAYFVRRIFGGVASWLFATFALYSLFVYPSISRYYPSEIHYVKQRFYYAVYGTITTYALDKPWPHNYLDWMWEPEGVVSQSYIIKSEATQGATLPPRTAEFSRLGLLRGDFGVSLFVNPGVSTLSMYGIDLLWFLGILFVPTFGLMLLAMLQRLGRQPIGATSFQAARVRYRIEAVRVLG